MKPLTQTILDHLRRVRSISGVEAAAMFRCRDLPKRISELRKEHGVSIEREMKEDTTGQRYARYHLCET